MEAKTLPPVHSLPHFVGRATFIKDRPVFATEQPYEVVGTLPPEQEHLRRNTEFELGDIPVYDLRQDFEAPSLDTHGFEFLRRPELSAFDIGSEDGLKDYLRAVLAFLQERFQTTDILVYNYNVRNSKERPTPEEYSGSQAKPQSIVSEAHTDGTDEGGFLRIRHQLGQDYAKYNDGSWRSRIVTLWRATRPVEEAPLALCDPSSLGSDDLINVARPGRDFVGEVSYVKHNLNQRWYFLSDQQPDELTLFSSYDSMDNTKIIGVEPDPSPRATKNRVSIDVRAIVLTKLE
ncbi:hypothetical protein B0T14DRAFT_568417 [Immersiella caudata]|uniref:CmcJ-like methyltransferase n=1 Tax=Immersiella caudata TaxID=314043 RepID=A0AA39WK83_9PEZI|nr:hypothetical protein B0T14DRAFT_568417 [Immersiella caudata]